MVTKPVIEVKVGTQTVSVLNIEYQIANGGAPSDTQPAASQGFIVITIPIEVAGLKLWVEYKLV